MAWFEWNDSFLTGIGEIDEQHRRLVALIDEFYSTIRTTAPRDSIERLLRGMLDYTHYHFETEERWMRDRSYPGLDAQIAQHAHFVERVQDITERFVFGQLVLSLEITLFLRDWLSQHILGMDKEMGQFLAARGAH